MREDNTEDLNVVKSRFDGISKTYDVLQQSLEGRLHEELEWERIIKPLLPEDKRVKILDAGGGTGRLTLPLAKLGYPVTLSDLSPGMLAVAREKLQQEGLLEGVEIKEADVAAMPFADETFGLVVCMHGPFCNTDSLKAAGELARVLQGGGVLVVDTLSRYWAATNVLPSEPEVALQLLKSERNHAYDIHGDWQRVFSPEEFRELFERNGIGNIRIHGSFYQLEELLPREVLEKQDWDDAYVSRLAEVLMGLGETPSTAGLARELILVGEKP